MKICLRPSVNGTLNPVNYDGRNRFCQIDLFLCCFASEDFWTFFAEVDFSRPRFGCCLKRAQKMRNEKWIKTTFV